METNGGWGELRSLIPTGLTIEQAKIYVCMAVYIDKVARPIDNVLIDKSTKSRDSKFCEREARIRLALAGIDVTVYGLVDLLTDGVGFTLSTLEESSVAANLMNIWLDYEICNGRWH